MIVLKSMIGYIIGTVWLFPGKQTRSEITPIYGIQYSILYVCGTNTALSILVTMKSV